MEFGDHGIYDVGEQVALGRVIVVQERVRHVTSFRHLFGCDVFVALFQEKLVGGLDNSDPLGQIFLASYGNTPPPVRTIYFSYEIQFIMSI